MKSRINAGAAIAVAAGTLAIGYVDLWRGGSSISAIALVLGYMIFVPVAILTPARARENTKR